MFWPFNRKPKAIDPHAAASALSRMGHERRRLTERERYDDFHARLRAEVAAQSNMENAR